LNKNTKNLKKYTYRDRLQECYTLECGRKIQTSQRNLVLPPPSIFIYNNI